MEWKEEIYALIPNFVNVKQTTVCTDIRFAKILDSIDDSGTCRERNAIVIRLADTTDSRHVISDEDVLGEVWRCSMRKVSYTKVNIT